MIWPRAMKKPAFLSRYPFAIVAAVNGPGNITPDRDIATTDNRNVNMATKKLLLAIIEAIRLLPAPLHLQMVFR